MKGKTQLNNQQLTNLLHECLETELGGVEVYKTALLCAINNDLKQEWEKYLDQTQNHVKIVERLFEQLAINPDADPPGRKVVRLIGQSLVRAMEAALSEGDAEAAQRTAAECVVEAETKDHLNWELLGQAAKKMRGDESRILKEAVAEVEEEEDEHLYHSTGWARELWMESLGLPAVLPPPEEERDVKTEIDAARAKQDRDKMAS
jgi:hypothetical protein